MPEKKPKTGRQISFWGSDAEAKRFNAAAKRAGISRSLWLNQAANEKAKK